MASPFRTFRKNQKAWMVALTILAMISFVFLGNWSGGARSGAEAKNPEVFTWKYGTIYRSDIERRRYLLGELNRFLQQAGAMAEVPPQRMVQFHTSEPHVVDTILLGKQAEQMGIMVSDARVNRFVTAYTEDRVTPQQLAGIIRSMRGGLTQAQLFDGIRGELAANYVRATFSPLLTRASQTFGVDFRGD